jgi:hypothetical protein
MKTVTKLKIVLLSAVLLCAGLSAACGGGGSTAPQSGFSVQGQKYVQTASGDFALVSVANVQGAWQFDNSSNAVGNNKTIPVELCVGPCPVTDGRVPARWTIIAGPFGECFGQLTNPNMDVNAGDTKIAKCVVPGILFPFSMNPGSVDLQATPATFDMTGSNLDTTYGAPHLDYIDSYTGDVIGSVDATAVSADGSWLQAPMPDLSQVYSGTYTIFVSNRQSDGSLSYVGSSTVDTYGRDGVYGDPPPDQCQPTYDSGGGGSAMMEQPVC